MYREFAKKAAAPLLGLGLVFGSAGGAYAQSVTVIHPDGVVAMGGSKYRQLDCGNFARVGNELYLTCAAAQQIDSNGQEICNITDGIPLDGKYTRDEGNKFSIALSYALLHFGRVHKDCIAQAGMVDDKIEASKGNPDYDPASTYGPDWQSRTSCTLTQARDLCKREMGIQGS